MVCRCAIPNYNYDVDSKVRLSWLKRRSHIFIYDSLYTCWTSEGREFEPHSGMLFLSHFEMANLTTSRTTGRHMIFARLFGPASLCFWKFCGIKILVGAGSGGFS